MSGIKAFFGGLLLIAALAAAMQGCSTIARLKDNPFVVRIAVSQAVLRYIESGNTQDQIAVRKQHVLSVMSHTLTYIDAGASASVDDIFYVFRDQLDLESMSLADQLLARETILLVQNNLQRRVESGELPADTVLVLRSIVLTAIDTANYL